MKRIAYGLMSVALMYLFYGSDMVFADSHEEKQMLIVFDEEVNKQAITEMVEDVGGNLTKMYEQVQVASVEVPEDSIDELLDNPSVKHVEEDIVLKLSAQVEDWGIQSVNIPTAWNSGFTGKGVKVAVIDSGIANHSDLTIAGGISTVNYTTSYHDDHGHGTHVAGIIGARNNSFGVKGVAFDTEIYAVKAFNQDGSAFLSDLIEGIDWSISNGMDIINLSSGTQTDSAAFHAIVDKASASGLLIVAAAGNDGAPDGLDDTVDFPARYATVIGVGAVDRNLARASFSSTGPDVEVAAPGVKILSTYLDNQYAYLSGTSMAAPYVTGELALLKQAYPRLTNKELRLVLIDHTRDLGASGRDSFFGYGLVQASSFTKSIEFEVENPVTGIRLSTKNISGLPGNIIDVTASAIYENGTVQSVTNGAKWSSANPAVATVVNGKVELKGYGSTTITVSYEGQTAVIVVDVPKPQPEPNPVVKLEANNTALIGAPGDIIHITASATYKNGQVQNVTNEAKWSSANTAIATVSQGKVVLKGYGSTILTVTYENQSTMIIVNIPDPQPVPNPIVKLETDKASLTGTPGESITVTAFATFKNGEFDDVTREAKWSSANTAVAMVDTGNVELKGYGSTTLTVTYEGQSAIVAINIPRPQPEPEPQTEPEPEPEPKPEPQPKTDVPKFEDVSTFYSPAVEYLVRHQITQGLSEVEFGVAKPILRADAAIWLAKELKLNTETAKGSGFTDVPERAVKAVNALKEAGIIGGKTKTRFGAYDSLTRGEVAIILQRAYNLSAYGNTSSFTDVSSRYQLAVDALVANKITYGITATQFGVSSNITRGQLAVFLYRLSGTK